MTLDLQADCASCVGLCCVAPGFAASADFALDKAPGEPCPNLRPDCRCGVHDRLRAAGFPGCAAFDCFGAGQRVSRGRHWRDGPEAAAALFADFGVMLQLHSLLWHLHAALALETSMASALQQSVAEIEALAGLEGAALRGVDVAAARRKVGALLAQVSAAVRGAGARDWSGRDLLGVDLRGRDLRRVALVGACLIGADLRGADLREADLRGADLRGADLRGVDLRGALFLSPTQLAGARG
ncbi:MAG: pentapeptide repeat-containing protein [Alphaproteobacteria bacterium]|nr:pentapeptide repeat-containing protein [Alphaproteobacteria bacterium]